MACDLAVDCVAGCAEMAILVDLTLSSNGVINFARKYLMYIPRLDPLESVVEHNQNES